MSGLPVLSALAKYDDLMRCQKELSSGIAEERFYLFLKQYEYIKNEHQRIIEEAKELQSNLDVQTQQTISFETKLNYARKLLEQERKSRREAEVERDHMEQKIVTLRDLLMSENTMKDETRKHLVQLSTYTKKRKSSHLLKEEEYGNDINSTGSFLSDLSLTQSGDDFLDSKMSGTHQKWKKHRPSYNNNSILNVSGKKTRMSMEKRRSTRQSLLDYGPNDKIVAQTKVTIPNDKRAPIIASSTIESIPYNLQTPSSSSGSSTEHINIQEPKLSNEGDRFKTPLKKQQPQTATNSNFYTPSAPSLEDLDHITEDLDTLYATVKKRPMGTLPTRLHKFASKTFLKPETCAVCQKRIRFGSAAYKCSECRTCAHQDCREKLTVSCLPQSASAANSKTGSMGIVGDYTPNVSPMIPALIVHCVNEIEMRGLTEIGLYRVSGGDREVKALKERFLRNKGIPYLNSIDIHVLCGCIKDFLRSLREPLIPLYLWTIFSNASQNVAEDDKDVYQAIDKLPQPNRDTLAYLIQHFQRIAECPAVKMPLTNFAKIFGPTIVGYTCSELDQHKIFAETQIQYNVMFSLLSIPTEYWNQFVNLNTQTKKEELKAFESYGSKFYSVTGTPSIKTSRKERKFYDTPPYAATFDKKKY